MDKILPENMTVAQALQKMPPGLRQEVSDLYKNCGRLTGKYCIIDKIGEGTFSSVYKAVNLAAVKKKSPRRQPLTSHSINLMNTHDNNDKATSINACDQPTIVALKRIYVTSSPTRILAELEVLKNMRHENVIPLLSAFRQDDQVIAVLPYFHHEDFRTYYSKMDVPLIIIYLKQLLESVKYIHTMGIIHRDIKPSNFLFNISTKRGVLVDFGLAQRINGPENNKSSSSRLPKAFNLRQYKQPGKYIKDPRYVSLKFILDERLSTHLIYFNRPPIRANRAGTRGFRAPEVLFKVLNQTTGKSIQYAWLNVCLLR